MFTVSTLKASSAARSPTVALRGRLARLATGVAGALYVRWSRRQHGGVTSKKGAYHHGDLAATLVHAAREVVVASGWEEVSLRAVARTIGVSATATYRHFPDKAALLRAVARDAFRELGTRMRRVQAREGIALARFEATGKAYFGYAIDHPQLFRLMFSPLGRDSAEGQGEPTPYEILGEALDGLVEAGVLDAEAREGAELLAWTSVHGLSTLALSGVLTSKRERKQALEEVLRFAVAGLRGR